VNGKGWINFAALKAGLRRDAEAVITWTYLTDTCAGIRDHPPDIGSSGRSGGHIAKATIRSERCASSRKLTGATPIDEVRRARGFPSARPLFDRNYDSLLICSLASDQADRRSRPLRLCRHKYIDLLQSRGESWSNAGILHHGGNSAEKYGDRL
jgi:hypothetical protein